MNIKNKLASIKDTIFKFNLKDVTTSIVGDSFQVCVIKPTRVIIHHRDRLPCLECNESHWLEASDLMFTFILKDTAGSSYYDDLYVECYTDTTVSLTEVVK